MAPLKHSLEMLRYQSWTAVCELPDGSTEIFITDVEIPVMDSSLWATGWLHWNIHYRCWDTSHGQPSVSYRMAPLNHYLAVVRYQSWTATCTVSFPLLKLCTNLNTVWPAGALSTNCRKPPMNVWRFNTILPQKPRDPFLPMIIAFHLPLSPWTSIAELVNYAISFFHRHMRIGSFCDAMLC